MNKKNSALFNRSGNIPVRWDTKRTRWELSFFSDGRRQRRYFREEKQALAEWKRICSITEKHGITASSYSTADHREFIEAKRIARNRDLRTVARFWAEHHPEEVETVKTSEAARQFLEQREGRNISERHIDTLKSHLSAFTAALGDKQLSSLTRATVLDWLLSLEVAPRTKQNYLGTLNNFFHWAARSLLIAKSPTETIAQDDLPVVVPHSKGVLTVEQASTMMTWVEKERPHFAAWHAVQLFAGIRNAEAGRLRWDWFDFKRKVLTLPGWTKEGDTDKRVVKTGDDWVLHDLPDNFWQWMSKYRKDEGKIRAPSPKAIERMRKNHFPQLVPPISPWPDNAMRHTFCTMAISLHQSADKVALWSRHQNARQLYDSYLAKLVSRAEAKGFFEILPAD